MATNAQFVQFGPYFSAGNQVTSLNVYHYSAGTLTLLNVWNDRAKTSTAAQPVQSDANGIVSFFADGLYKYKVTSGTPGSDTTLYTYDNVATVDVSAVTLGKGADLTSASTLTLGTDGNYFHVTGSTGITAISGTLTSVTLKFDSTPLLTHSSNLILPGATNITAAAGDVAVFVQDGGTTTWRCVSYTKNLVPSELLLTTKGDILTYSTLPIRKGVGSNGRAVVADSNRTDGLDWNYPVLRSYLAGCILSTAGSSATMTIAAGQGADSTNVKLIDLSASISKTTSAWVVGTGNGGLDTGVIGNNTWYHFYLLYRPDTQVTDIIFSTSASAPTLPANYTLYRRIGSGRTNGAAQWTLFTQDGRYFRWSASVLDVNTTNPGTNAVTSTLTVPTGVTVYAIVNGTLTQGTAIGGATYLLSDLSATDEVPSSSAAPLGDAGYGDLTGNIAFFIQGNSVVRTNTSAQIRYRISFSDANTTMRIATLGWWDRAGKDS